ncbi:MAG: class I SAM-dependent methyltransferase [Pirellulales bacterium]
MNKLRNFNWVSTSNATKQDLDALQKQMLAYYSQDATRSFYQAMLDSATENQPAVLQSLTEEIVDRKPSKVIELGCGSGWILEELVKRGLKANQYTGAEFSSTVIEQNRQRQPEATWHVLTDYECDEPAGKFDAAYSYFVIEHCVYPERHLEELWRLIRPGGWLYLVCPDFVVGGIFPSQYLGAGQSSAKDLLRKGRVVAGLVSLYDSRIRIRQALANLEQERGNFVINLTPTCLVPGFRLVPDVDAVYISNHRDVIRWASDKHSKAEFPKFGSYAGHSSILFAKIQKPSL